VQEALQGGFHAPRQEHLAEQTCQALDQQRTDPQDQQGDDQLRGKVDQLFLESQGPAFGLS
jgi:hypothetical protein